MPLEYSFMQIHKNFIQMSAWGGCPTGNQINFDFSSTPYLSIGNYVVCAHKNDKIIVWMCKDAHK